MADLLASVPVHWLGNHYSEGDILAHRHTASIPGTHDDGNRRGPIRPTHSRSGPVADATQV
jgi:hypothetical protein